MFFLLLTTYFSTVVFAAPSYGDEEEERRIDIFERYAGDLIFGGGEGKCIACSNEPICDEEHYNDPRSWKATLGEKNVFEDCWNYAMSVGKFGVVAFTWWNETRQCSLHVENQTEEDIAHEMLNFNGYNWSLIDEENTGPLFRTRFRTRPEFDDSHASAVCYYGLKTNRTPNIVREANLMCFLVVVTTMVLWVTWVRYTGTYPEWCDKQVFSDSELGDIAGNLISSYSPKKDE